MTHRPSADRLHPPNVSEHNAEEKKKKKRRSVETLENKTKIKIKAQVA